MDHLAVYDHTVNVDAEVEALAARYLAGETGLLSRRLSFTTLDSVYRAMGATDLGSLYTVLAEQGVELLTFAERTSFLGGEAKRWKLANPAIGMSSERPALPGLLLAHAVELVKALDFAPEVVVGLAQSGIPLGSAVSLACNRPLAVSRVLHPAHTLFPHSIPLYEPADEFGTYVVCCQRGTRIWLIDDEITTGESVTSFITSLRGEGVVVSGVGAAFELVLPNVPTGVDHVRNTTGVPVEASVRMPYPLADK